MKFVCLQENLQKSLSVAGRAVSTKASLPVLSNFLIKAENGELSISSTNLETYINIRINASVDEAGIIAVPAKLFSDYISNLAPGNVTISLTDLILKVESGRTRSKFNCMSPEDFPSIPSFSDESAVEIIPREFSHALSLTAFCSATDELRPILTGIYFYTDEDKLFVVATDGFRLSESSINIVSGNLGSPVVIPARTVTEASKIFSSGSENVRFTYDSQENLAVFSSGNTIVATRVLEGSFPDYKRIIPESGTTNAVIVSSDLNEAVRLNNVFSKDADSIIKLNFLVESSTLSLSSQSEQSGENITEIPVSVSGNDLMVPFNTKYLMDFLNNVKQDKIVFYSNGESSPCMFKPENMSNFLHVIMPVRLNS